MGGEGFPLKPEGSLDSALVLNVVNLNEKVGYFHRSSSSRGLNAKGRSKSSQKDFHVMRRLDTVTFIDHDLDARKAQLSSESEVDATDSVEILKNEILEFEIDDVIADQQLQLFEDI